ncbi:MAG TPA: hypothetical protein VEU53_12245 [Stellaceae bacterium]|nr:hypothetical protein [Stellaceae bacterium]
MTDHPDLAGPLKPTWNVRRLPGRRPPMEPPALTMPDPLFGEPKAERSPRSLSDVDFRNELDDLVNPLKDATSFVSAFHVWAVAAFKMIIVTLPLAFIAWRLLRMLDPLIRAFSGNGVPVNVP